MLQLTFKRYEIKYLLTEEQHDRLRILMNHHMVPDEWGPSTVCNVYYDTPSHLLVRRSAEHPNYKEKVRVRSYGLRKEDGPVFLELKKKVDGVVYKRRATLDAERARELLSGNGTPTTQIERELDYSCRRYGGLEPSFFIAYDREAFYDPNDHEFRMTFDRRVRTRTTNMCLTYSDEGEQLLEDGLVLLEVKAGGAVPLWLVEFLSGEGLYKTSFSKVGMAWQRELKQELTTRKVAAVSGARQLRQPVREWNPSSMTVPAMGAAVLA